MTLVGRRTAGLIVAGLLFFPFGSPPALGAATVPDGTYGPPAIPGATVTLSLRPGMLPSPAEFPVPADMSPDVPTVTLPVYPMAVPLAAKPQGPGSFPLTPFLKTGAAIYLVSDPPSDVVSWYEGALPALGYQVSGYGQSGGAGAPSVQDATFTEPTRPGLSVQVEAWVVGGRTRLELWGLDVEPPTRPAASRLQGTVTRVDFQVWPDGSLGGQPPVQARLAATAPLTALVTAFNALPMSTLGTCACPMDNGRRAYLAFLGADGMKTTVTVDPARENVIVDGRFYLAVGSDTGSFWSAVLTALGAAQPIGGIAPEVGLPPPTEPLLPRPSPRSLAPGLPTTPVLLAPHLEAALGSKTATGAPPPYVASPRRDGPDRSVPVRWHGKAPTVLVALALLGAVSLLSWRWYHLRR